MAAKKKKVSGCKCAGKINKLLAPRNGRLLTALHLKGAPSHVYVAVEKLDLANKMKPPFFAVSYCPFCGKKAPG